MKLVVVFDGNITFKRVFKWKKILSKMQKKHRYFINIFTGCEQINNLYTSFLCLIFLNFN
jgi:hypothetical protein